MDTGSVSACSVVYADSFCKRRHKGRHSLVLSVDSGNTMDIKIDFYLESTSDDFERRKIDTYFNVY